MPIVSPTARSVREQQREKSMRKREAAGTLATAFPRTELVHIHIQFVPMDGPVPAARTHTLYPSAHAYFEFACPHGDCNGGIDLNTVAVQLLRDSGDQANGTLHCHGTRTADGGVRRQCNLRVDYWIAARYRSATRAAS